MDGDFFADGFEEFEGGVFDGGGLGVEDEVWVLGGSNEPSLPVKWAISPRAALA